MWKLLIVHESQLLLETSKQCSHSFLSFVCKFAVIYTQINFGFNYFFHIQQTCTQDLLGVVLYGEKYATSSEQTVFLITGKLMECVASLGPKMSNSSICSPWNNQICCDLTFTFETSLSVLRDHKISDYVRVCM